MAEPEPRIASSGTLTEKLHQGEVVPDEGHTQDSEIKATEEHLSKMPANSPKAQLATLPRDELDPRAETVGNDQPTQQSTSHVLSSNDLIAEMMERLARLESLLGTPNNNTSDQSVESETMLGKLDKYSKVVEGHGDSIAKLASWTLEHSNALNLLDTLNLASYCQSIDRLYDGLEKGFIGGRDPDVMQRVAALEKAASNANAALGEHLSSMQALIRDSTSTTIEELKSLGSRLKGVESTNASLQASFAVLDDKETVISLKAEAVASLEAKIKVVSDQRMQDLDNQAQIGKTLTDVQIKFDNFMHNSKERQMHLINELRAQKALLRKFAAQLVQHETKLNPANKVVGGPQSLVTSEGTSDPSIQALQDQIKALTNNLGHMQATISAIDGRSRISNAMRTMEHEIWADYLEKAIMTPPECSRDVLGKLQELMEQGDSVKRWTRKLSKAKTKEDLEELNTIAQGMKNGVQIGASIPTFNKSGEKLSTIIAILERYLPAEADSSQVIDVGRSLLTAPKTLALENRESKNPIEAQRSKEVENAMSTTIMSTPQASVTQQDLSTTHTTPSQNQKLVTLKFSEPLPSSGMRVDRRDDIKQVPDLSFDHSQRTQAQNDSANQLIVQPAVETPKLSHGINPTGSLVRAAQGNFGGNVEMTTSGVSHTAQSMPDQTFQAPLAINPHFGHVVNLSRRNEDTSRRSKERVAEAETEAVGRSAKRQKGNSGQWIGK